MQRHHTGSGRRSVIPTDWSAHHRPVAAATWTASVTIRHPGATSGPLDEHGKRTSTQNEPHHTGQARIQVQPIFGSEKESAGQKITTAGYLVCVELAGSAATKVDDLVKVTAVDDNGDPSLVGRELTVNGIARGSLAWERDLTCSDDLG